MGSTVLRRRRFVVAALVVCAYWAAHALLPRSVAPGVSLYVIQPALWFLLSLYVLRLLRRAHTDALAADDRVVIAAVAVGGLQVVGSVAGGLLYGFGRSPYSHTLVMVLLNLLYAGTSLLGIELARAYLIGPPYRRNPTLSLFLAAVFTCVVSLPPASFASFRGARAALFYLVVRAIPTFAEHYLATLLCFLGGVAAAVAYRGTLLAYEWLSPVLPHLPWYASALLRGVVPALAIVPLSLAHQDRLEARPGSAPHDAPTRLARLKRRRIARRETLWWTSFSLLAFLALWFSAGVFSLKPLLVAGHSMRPTYRLGDIVIVARVDPDTIGVGDIVAYRSDGGYVVHRVIAVETTEGARAFRTKGDANSVPDSAPVRPEQLVGRCVLRIPLVGWVSIALKNTVWGLL